MLCKDFLSLTSVVFLYTFVSSLFAPEPPIIWMGTVVVLSFCTRSFRTYLRQGVLGHVHAYTCTARLDARVVIIIRRF